MAFAQSPIDWLTVCISNADIVPSETSDDSDAEQHEDVIYDWDEDLPLDEFIGVDDPQLGENAK